MRPEQLGVDALRALIDASADGILFVDSDGAITYANLAARALFDRDDLVGSHFGIPLVGGEKTELEVPHRGRTVVVELRTGRTEVDGGEVYLVSLHDITDRREAEAERDRVRREAEAVARTRSTLLNMAAHELRTPVTVITGYLSMLADESLGPIPADWRGVISQVNEKAGELRVMVDEILIAARLEAGRVGRKPEVVDLRTVVRSAVKRAAGRGPGRLAQIKLDGPRRPVLASVDGAQVGVVLDNLLNNAIHYSSEDDPWIHVEVRASDGVAEVCVSDHGIGIPPEMQALVFEPFRRVPASDGRPRPGTGLGLAIARDFARLNQGDLRLAQSELGRGSSFVLTLPLADSAG